VGKANAPSFNQTAVLSEASTAAASIAAVEIPADTQSKAFFVSISVFYIKI